MSITAGQKLNGKITSVKKFGAFVELENGKSGLVHISELSEKFVEKVEDVVSVGQEVTVRVKEVTPEGKLTFNETCTSRKTCTSSFRLRQGNH